MNKQQTDESCALCHYYAVALQNAHSKKTLAIPFRPTETAVGGWARCDEDLKVSSRDARGLQSRGARLTTRNETRKSRKAYYDRPIIHGKASREAKSPSIFRQQIRGRAYKCAPYFASHADEMHDNQPRIEIYRKERPLL